MTPLETLTESLSQGLNRAVPQSLATAVVGMYRNTGTKEQFAEATKVLGFSESLAQSIYAYVNDNIGWFADEAPRKEPRKLAKRSKLTVDFASMEDDFGDLDGPALGLGDDLTSEAKPVKKPLFKKLKKDTARKLKESLAPSLRAEASEKPKEKEVTAVEEPAPQAEDSTADPDLEDYPLDVSNDREWYTMDGAVSVDPYLDMESAYSTQARPKFRKAQSLQASGGHFDLSGRYVDYDHDTENTRRKVQVVCHFVVPPFLKGAEADIRFDFTPTHSRATVSPVKDPESELAVLARLGSAVLRERLEKKERAQQARDRVGAEPAAKAVEPASEKEPSKTQSYTQDEIQRQRRSLPAYQVRDQLMRIIAENQIVVVVGETGSGKTTQIAQFLAEEGYTKTHKVACTQPRRVAAMSVAKRVAEEMNTPLGQRVGYTIRFEDRTSSRTEVKFMTEGILLREVIEDPFLSKYLAVIMDEAHERSLNTDVLLGLFRGLLRKRRDLRLIVTSATMNAARFAAFFGHAPQFSIPGRTFPVDVMYARTACPDYVELAAKQVVTIHLANAPGDGDILVFMTGQEDIEATCDLVREKLAVLENPPPLDIYPIYSALPADVQKKIFDRLDRRKVVVATNIAETSLTVDGVRYVVDSGLVKMKVFNAKLGMDALQVVPVALANAQQRLGRAGRTMPGLAYRLYTETAVSEAHMYTQPIPEIQRAQLSSVTLLLKTLKVDDVAGFPFLDPPPPDLLSCSLYELWAMGALQHDGALSPLGAQMARFPMEPTLAKLLLLSALPAFACLAEIVTIVAMLSVPSVFFRPAQRADDADAMRERFLVLQLDHLTLLNVYTQWEQHRGPAQAWCTRHFLHLKSLVRARDVRRQLVAILAQQKLPVVRSTSDDDIRRCICAAYYHQAAALEATGGGRGRAVYSSVRQPYMKMHLHPTSAVAASADLSPLYVVYNELVLTKKEYMHCVTAVDAEWLLQYGRVFYGVLLGHQELRARGVDVADPETLQREMEASGSGRSKATAAEKRTVPKTRAF